MRQFAKPVFLSFFICFVGPTAADELVVGTKHSPPFSYQDENGEWKGISIELWRRVAEKLGLDYEIRELPLEQMFEQLESGQLDVAVAAISVTPEREGRLDFSHPYYTTGIGVAVPVRGKRQLSFMLQRIFTVRFFQIVGAAVILMLLGGTLFWYFEKQRNAIFSGKTMEGIGEGIWWSTILLLGHKGVVPRSYAARLMALSVMLVSFVAVSVLTGAVASVMTLSQLTSPIAQPEDLRRMRTTSVTDSTSGELLRLRRIGFTGFKTLEEAIGAVADGSYDAVVYDAPMLRYLANTRFQNSIIVLPARFSVEEYAIALMSDSPLRKSINQALLSIRNEEDWQNVLYTHLGD